MQQHSRSEANARLFNNEQGAYGRTGEAVLQCLQVGEIPVTRRAWPFRCVALIAACHKAVGRMHPRSIAVFDNAQATSMPQIRDDLLVRTDEVIQ